MDTETLVILEKITEVAKNREITYYSDIAPLVGLDMSFPSDRNHIARILDEISRTESTSGRPLLSAVVVQKGENIPGNRFFTLAKELRLYSGTDDDAFWSGEVRRVHEYWSGCK